MGKHLKLSLTRLPRSKGTVLMEESLFAACVVKDPLWRGRWCLIHKYLLRFLLHTGQLWWWRWGFDSFNRMFFPFRQLWRRWHHQLTTSSSDSLCGCTAIKNMHCPRSNGVINISVKQLREDSYFLIILQRRLQNKKARLTHRNATHQSFIVKLHTHQRSTGNINGSINSTTLYYIDQWAWKNMYTISYKFI